MNLERTLWLLWEGTIGSCGWEAEWNLVDLMEGCCNLGQQSCQTQACIRITWLPVDLEPHYMLIAMTLHSNAMTHPPALWQLPWHKPEKPIQGLKRSVQGPDHIPVLRQFVNTSPFLQSSLFYLCLLIYTVSTWTGLRCWFANWIPTSPSFGQWIKLVLFQSQHPFHLAVQISAGKTRTSLVPAKVRTSARVQLTNSVALWVAKS